MAEPKNGPLVSICIPTYNEAGFIRKSLDSIINQTYANKEIIVSDNISTDGTADIVLEYVRQYGIKFYEQKEHYPAAEYNFDKCMQLSKSELVSIYHADDIYNPDIVAHSVEILQRHQNVGAVFTMANKIDEKGRRIGRYRLPRELKGLNRDFYTFDEIFNCVLKYGNAFLICPSATIKRPAYEVAGGWDYSKYRIAADLGLWLKIAQKYDIAIIETPLMDYRISRMQATSRYAWQRIDRGHFFLVMDEYLNMIKGRRFEKYYDVHRIVDLTYRALNLSIANRMQESNRLIKEIFLIYFKNLFTMSISTRTLECLLTAIVLLAINKLPLAAGIAASFRDLVLKLRHIRTRLCFL